MHSGGMKRSSAHGNTPSKLLSCGLYYSQQVTNCKGDNQNFKHKPPHTCSNSFSVYIVRIIMVNRQKIHVPLILLSVVRRLQGHLPSQSKFIHNRNPFPLLHKKVLPFHSSPNRGSQSPQFLS